MQEYVIPEQRTIIGKTVVPARPGQAIELPMKDRRPSSHECVETRIYIYPPLLNCEPTTEISFYRTSLA